MKIQSTTVEEMTGTSASVTLRLGDAEGEHIAIRMTVPLLGDRPSIQAIQATALFHAQQLIGGEMNILLEQSRLALSQLPQRH